MKNRTYSLCWGATTFLLVFSLTGCSNTSTSSSAAAAPTPSTSITAVAITDGELCAGVSLANSQALSFLEQMQDLNGEDPASADFATLKQIFGNLKELGQAVVEASKQSSRLGKVMATNGMAMVNFAMLMDAGLKSALDQAKASEALDFLVASVTPAKQACVTSGFNQQWMTGKP